MDYSNSDRKVPATKKRPSRSAKKWVSIPTRATWSWSPMRTAMSEVSNKRRVTALSFEKEVPGNVSISATLMKIFLMS